MLAFTVPYRTGRIHLVECYGDFSACAEQHTHVPLERQDDWWVAEYVTSLMHGASAISDLRRLIAQTGAAHDLTRANDRQVMEQVALLLSRGYLSAIACGQEALLPAVTVAIQGKRFHVGLGVAGMAMCDYQRSHRIVRHDDVQATRTFFEELTGDAENVKELRRFAFAQTGLRDLAPDSSDAMLLEKLVFLVGSRRLSLVECGRSYFDLAGATAEEERLARRAGSSSSSGSRSSDGNVVEEKVKTWIEIKLVDQDGNPVANEAYKLKLPDGSVKEGTLDAQGRVRLEEIDPGNCTVCFPDIDQHEWKPA